MQTFLPYPDFEASARCLDRKRLGKQRVEAYQILRVLAGETRGWRSHPAVLMWEGYSEALAAYGAACCREWIRRGYRDMMLVRFAGTRIAPLPPWLGGPIHASHRSNLLRKAPEHYGQFGWQEPPDMAYFWPVDKSAAHSPGGRGER